MVLNRFNAQRIKDCSRNCVTNVITIITLIQNQTSGVIVSQFGVTASPTEITMYARGKPIIRIVIVRNKIHVEFVIANALNFLSKGNKQTKN